MERKFLLSKEEDIAMKKEYMKPFMNICQFTYPLSMLQGSDWKVDDDEIDDQGAKDYDSSEDWD